MDKSKRPYRRIKCARKGCGKCLYCLKITALCTCTDEDKAGEPRNVLYGWCVKCRSKYPDDYNRVIGTQCTYCGADVEDSFTTTGMIAVCLLFPLGIAICCATKETKCVACDRAFM
eukprot:TRINITY_DN20851_c0_g1_i1.p1 TRINITY_DN20851_c0_g1~~TRINITY_DN20851_c0_g1_i1.p1  ORF type:complete len:116 (-),score=21.48 TRINITY_DN20851_c0_g1_i1:24-371(-)